MARKKNSKKLKLYLKSSKVKTQKNEASVRKSSK